MTRGPGRLILASTSQYRRKLLDDLGLVHEALPHQCDEAPYKERGLSPGALAQELARAKALSLAQDHPEAWILGSDQVAELDGEILSKPVTQERARAQLAQMQGRTHRLITAVALRTPRGNLLQAVQLHSLTMRPLGPEAIARYIAHDLPLDCCGSYKIEGRGIALFEKIEGHDHTAIIGLPLMQVCELLRQEGWELP